MFRLNAIKDGKPITFTVPLPGGKRAQVRYPTDKEWCDRVHQLKIIRTSLGRDKSQSDVPNQAAADLALYERIRQDDTPIDAAEAALIIDVLDRCRVASVDPEGHRYRIALEVQKATVSHLVRLPSPAETAEYERGSITVIGGKKHVEMHPAMEPAGLLYDRIAVSNDGYAGAVPITHKYAIVAELMEEISRLIAETDIELPEE